MGWARHTLLAEAVQHHYVFAQAKAVSSGSLRGHDGDKEMVRELSLGSPKLLKESLFFFLNSVYVHFVWPVHRCALVV